jgi:hypothetical protein
MYDVTSAMLWTKYIWSQKTVVWSSGSWQPCSVCSQCTFPATALHNQTTSSPYTFQLWSRWKCVPINVSKIKKKNIHEGVWGSVYIRVDPHFLDLGTNWKWAVSFTPLPLYSRGKRPPYPLDRRLSGPQSRSGWRGRRKNSWPSRNSNPDSSVVQPVASRCTTTLSRWSSSVSA